MKNKSGEVLTYKQFADMPYQELHNELKKMIQQAKRLSIWFTAGERFNLLPALQAMHDKVAQPGRRTDLREAAGPTWDAECQSLGITPELFRQWKRRTQTDTDIQHLLGEKPKEPGMKKQSGENAQAVRDLHKLCIAVLENDYDGIKAEEIALAIAERYGF